MKGSCFDQEAMDLFRPDIPTLGDERASSGAQEAFKTPVLYPLADLARAAGVERRRMARTLEAEGVPLRRKKRVRYVLVSDLERQVPALWEVLRERLLSGADVQ